MKKFIILCIAVVGAMTSFAQNKIDFFDFARSFNWQQSETDFKTLYNDRIVFSTDSIPDVHTLTGSWMLGNVYIGEYETTTLVTYDEKKQMFAAMIAIPTEPIDHKICIEMETIINRKLGESDVSLTDVELATLNMANLGVEKGNVKVWMSDSATFMTVMADDGEQNIFVVGAGVSIAREPDFRQGFWGDSLDDIKRKEKKSDEFRLNGIYAFTTYVAGLRCLAAYRFTNDKLTSGKYVFLDNNSDNCIRNYETLINLLTKKYGVPIHKDKKNSANSYEQRIYTDGELVKQGKINCKTYWSTPFSKIIIFLNGEQYKISLNIEYYSNKFDEEREQDILKDL